MTAPPANCRQLLECAHRPTELATLVFARVIGQALADDRRPLLRGISEAGFQKLLNEHFILEATLTNGEETPGADADNEYADLVTLLLEHRAEPTETNAWLAYAIASACMGENHLWQDMGMPSRQGLSDLMAKHFPTLVAKNAEDMKWKKFFYRQLCLRAGVSICKSPRCADCHDYAICFGPEE